MKQDVEALKQMIAAELPVSARWWLNDTPLDYHFTDAKGELRTRYAIGAGLRQVAAHDVHGGVDELWRDLLIFGFSDYAEGGGASAWIAMRTSDGTVCGLDPERDDPVFLFNSSIESFIRTFKLLDRYLKPRHPLPRDVAAAASEIDQLGYPFSEWRLLIDHLLTT